MRQPPVIAGGKGSVRRQNERRNAAGHERIFTIVAALVDTNILVYRFDGRFPDKQKVANQILRNGIETDSIRIAHQAVLEFFAAVTRKPAGRDSLLSIEDARRETEDLLNQFTVLYPTEDVVRTAIRGHATYQFSWFDAQTWAHAEYYGLDEIITEDFEHARRYGAVRARNPF